MLAPGTKDAEQELYGRRLSLSMNFHLLDHAAKFDGFYSLDLKEFLEVFKQVYFKTNEATKLKDFLGISHVSNPTNVVDWVSRDSFLPLISSVASLRGWKADAALPGELRLPGLGGPLRQASGEPGVRGPAVPLGGRHFRGVGARVCRTLGLGATREPAVPNVLTRAWGQDAERGVHPGRPPRLLRVCQMPGDWV
jgi:hypothetical protein